MTADASLTAEARSTGEWRSIRPWTRRLALSVCEITSVSATFILSSPLTTTNNSDDDDEGEQSAGDYATRGTVSDALGKGLSVEVNAAHWQRVLIRVDEAADEAVIIIYGLMPGRQYDIDLGLQDSSIRSHVTTEEDRVTTDEDSPLLEPASLSTSASASTSISTSTPTPAPSTTTSPTPTPETLEDRLAHLHRSLTTLTTTRDALSALLKSTRRDSQKADAALRAEIDVLNRASEKNAAAEPRARQRVLALQEAARRARTAAEEITLAAGDVDAQLPALTAHVAEVEVECKAVKREAGEARCAREEVESSARKRLDSLKAELAAQGHRLDKHAAKRERSAPPFEPTTRVVRALSFPSSVPFSYPSSPPGTSYPSSPPGTAYPSSPGTAYPSSPPATYSTSSTTYPSSATYPAQTHRPTLSSPQLRYGRVTIARPGDGIAIARPEGVSGSVARPPAGDEGGGGGIVS
ncbi:hypothetical protein BJ138DRAFT_422812 [Hygrophoropsis aurantiaca]|uniref:Uncharacterized protein n=1 Tax=Hygrophoropsis aurantiaca TaxID=72124 RepID=A0ACB8A4F3_9AGAM|nr:hypothetical protein BJ138DRAFT_422812 [Hygrophoropsis aurantiaca]